MLWNSAEDLITSQGKHGICTFYWLELGSPTWEAQFLHVDGQIVRAVFQVAIGVEGVRVDGTPPCPRVEDGRPTEEGKTVAGWILKTDIL